MSGWKKLAAASAAGGGGLNVEDLFSTYLYDGNSGAQTFVNGLDLAGEGGLVWSKRRNGATSHILVDSERNVSTYAYILNSDNANAQSIEYGWNWSFNSNGYSLNTTSAEINDTPSKEYCSWSFRKAPKFFDIVTWNGNSTARTISHNLGQKPGMILVKALNNVRDWAVWHKDLNTNEFLVLNTSNSTSTDSNVFTATEPTSTEFSIGTDLRVNYSAFSYVAYVFADNNGEGEFGPDSDQDIIKCGSYTGTGISNAGPVVDVGFEPQFLLIKGSNGNWTMVDSMRGFATKPANSAMVYANRTNPEFSTDWFSVTPTGFQPMDNSNDINSSGQKYIYMAIRRGPMAAPESATDVFAIDTADGTLPTYQSGFTVDMGIQREMSGNDNWGVGTRLIQGKALFTNVSDDEENNSFNAFDYMDHWFSGTRYSDYISYMWKRAPSFFDVVTYNGNSTDGRTVSHNLGVVPEMMWVKRRDNYHGGQSWVVYHKNLDATNPAHKYLRLNDSEGVLDSDGKWYDTAPTDSVFTVANNTDINNSNGKYIAYLFATLDGISKVGSYTGNGSSQTINCGFTSGARFILIKRTIANSNWFVFDTVRGIVSGNDAEWYMDTFNTSSTARDVIDPLSSGFSVTNDQTAGLNVSGGIYIFYAIA